MFITGYAPFADKGILIRVETDIRRGIPGIDISGLADGAVKESRERIRAAFRNSGLEFPLDRILINMAPAGVKKEGAELDLTIALSVMAAAGLVPGLAALPEQLMVLGELELSGRVRPVHGVLAAVAAGLGEGIRFYIVPKENEEEAAVLLHQKNKQASDVSAVQCAAVSSLDEAAHALVLLTKEGMFPPPFLCRHSCADNAAPAFPLYGDFAEVRGQHRYKRALEVAAAGGHNLFVFGAPGAGKTMLARRLPSIMAPLSAEEAVEVTRIHSIAGQPCAGNGFSLITDPPFRSPHHSASAEGILGGGRTVRPGEISLAHYGVLFLDEAPEFKTNVMQALREPLEDKLLTIVRATRPVRLPADFMLVMAANVCPCGRLGASAGVTADSDSGASSECFCSPEEVHRYWKKFGGALLDRIEIRVPVQPSQAGLRLNSTNEPSSVIRQRVIQAVEIQRRRFAHNSNSGIHPNAKDSFAKCRRNAHMSPGQIEMFCPLSKEAEHSFNKAADRLGFSGRAYFSILKTARTIADIDSKEIIEEEHVLEAIQHRRLGDDPYDVFDGE